MTDLDFHHIFIPGQADKPVLLLLHGTGGDENDLIGLGQKVAPGFAILSPRGKVLENGMPRFFRRLAEGIFDMEDLHFRTKELSGFIAQAKEKYALQEKKIIALGFSNGANIAASLLLQGERNIDGAILARAMIPFQPEQLPALKGKEILMLSGLMDPIIPIENARSLATILEQSGASVTFKALPASHNLTQPELLEMTNWLRTSFR